MTQQPDKNRTSVRAWRRLSCVAVGVAALCAAGSASAQVLEIQPDGSVVTYNGPTVFADGTAKVISLTPIRPPGVRGAESVPSSEIADAIRKSADRYGVSAHLLEAVAWRESGFRQQAVSPKGAIGVMQLMPSTAHGLGVDPKNPIANIDGGAAYLSRMMSRYDGDVVRALAAYNAGPGAVEKYGGAPPYAETRAYVGAILDRLARSGARLTLTSSGGVQ